MKESANSPISHVPASVGAAASKAELRSSLESPAPADHVVARRNRPPWTDELRPGRPVLADGLERVDAVDDDGVEVSVPASDGVEARGPQPAGLHLTLAAREPFRGHERCAEAEAPAGVRVDDGERPSCGASMHGSAPIRRPRTLRSRPPASAPSTAAAITLASGRV